MNLLLCQIKSVVCLALALCVSAVSSSKVTVDTERFKGTKPNVLILFADDLGYGDLSDYGHPTTSTPNLDSLANKGVKFTQWYSGFHVCSPKYPHAYQKFVLNSCDPSKAQSLFFSFRRNMVSNLYAMRSF